MSILAVLQEWIKDPEWLALHKKRRGPTMADSIARLKEGRHGAASQPEDHARQPVP